MIHAGRGSLGLRAIQAFPAELLYDGAEVSSRSPLGHILAHFVNLMNAKSLPRTAR